MQKLILSCDSRYVLDFDASVCRLVHVNTIEKLMFSGPILFSLQLHKLMVRLVQDSEDPTLTPAKRFKILQTLECSQSKVFVNTHILYGNTCDRLAQAYAEAGNLPKSIEWCTKAHKVILVHFPHDSIEVAQETLKLAGLLFNKLSVGRFLCLFYSHVMLCAVIMFFF